MTINLEKLNRLRVNAGKPELAAWKASKAKLAEAITALEAAGFIDVLPGANIEVKPITDDPVVKAVLPPEEEPQIRTDPEDRKEPEVTKAAPKLARGLETEQMARQSRAAVQMNKEREKREAKKAKAEEKEAAKAEPKGKVDPKKDPDKAARQEKHIKDKKAARAGKEKPARSADVITVADIARSLGKDPKIARAKLRRHEDKIKHLRAPGEDGWVFRASAEKELISILK